MTECHCENCLFEIESSEDFSYNPEQEENTEMILDTTCSTKKIWPEKADIRIDILRSVRPDIQASACFLPFRAGVFDEIYTDPPHFVGNPHFSKTSIMRKQNYCRFGFWDSKSQWFQFLVSVNSEFERCLKPEGTLHFKVSENSKYVDTMTSKKSVVNLLSRFVLLTFIEHAGFGFAKWTTTFFLSFVSQKSTIGAALSWLRAGGLKTAFCLCSLIPKGEF